MNPRQIKPLPNTPNPDQRAAIVKDALDAVSPTFRPDKPFAGEDVLKKAMECSKAVNAVIKPFLTEAHSKLGNVHDKKYLSQIIGKAYLEAFGTWEREEILYLMVFLHTQIAVESITGETGESGLIIPS